MQQGASLHREHKSLIVDSADPEFDNRIVLFGAGSIRPAFVGTSWFLLADGNKLQKGISMKQKCKYLQAIIKTEHDNPYSAKHKYAKKSFDTQLRK